MRLRAATAGKQQKSESRSQGDYHVTRHSEHDSGIELHYPRRAGSRGDLAEAGGGDVDIRSCEDHPVEWIESVGLKCQFHAFADWEFAPQAQAVGIGVRIVKSE